MGAGTLRRHRAMLDAPRNPTPPSLQDQLDAEKARSAALHAELVERTAKGNVSLDAADVEAAMKAMHDAAEARVSEIREETDAFLEEYKSEGEAKIATANDRIKELEGEIEAMRAAAAVPAAPPEAPAPAAASEAPVVVPVATSEPTTTPDPPRGSRRTSGR